MSAKTTAMHHPDCDINDTNIEGIRKPCNCGAATLVESAPESRPTAARCAGSTGSTLVDATLLIERIITHLDTNRDTANLREQIALAVMGAHEIGPRLAKLAGCRWLPNT